MLFFYAAWAVFMHGFLKNTDLYIYIVYIKRNCKYNIFSYVHVISLYSLDGVASAANHGIHLYFSPLQ